MSSAAYTPYTNSTKGRGYVPFTAIQEQNSIGNGMDSTGDPIGSSSANDTWERFFGKPPYTTWQHDNYADLGHENYQLPTAYIGRNLHIEKLLNVSIASQDDFYTRVLLPWKVYDGMKITFSKWSGFDHMMYQIPEEVPAPQIQTKFESGEAYQQRYGLAFKMEHGFQRTEMGRQAYSESTSSPSPKRTPKPSMNLQIITQAVLRTVYSRIMQVIVNNQNFLQVLANKYFPSRMALAREVSKTSVNTFGCMQKDTFGIEMALNGVQKLFEARQIQAPDSIILPHGSMAYMSLAKPERRIYALCGALAERLNLDPKRELAVNVFGNNLSVFEHRNMNVSDNPHDVNILSRHRDVGNVWRIFRDPHSENGGRLNEETCIRVIDHDRQRWVPICFSEALRNCAIWNEGVVNNLNSVASPQMDHIANPNAPNHPLIFDDGTNAKTGRMVFGDLNIFTKGANDPVQLTMETVYDAAMSLAKKLTADKVSAVDGTYNDTNVKAISKELKGMIKNSIWAEEQESYENHDSSIDQINNRATAAPVGASMEDLVGTLQDAIADQVGGFEGTEEQYGVIASSLNEILAKAVDWSDRKRYTVAEAIKAHAGEFTKSAGKLADLKTADASKSDKATQDYVKALGSEFKSKWGKINATQKQIGSDLDSAVPIGAVGPTSVLSNGTTTAKAIADPKNFNHALHYIWKNSNWPNHVKICASYWLGISIDLPTVNQVDSLGVVTPFGAFVFRPFQSFNMGSAVVMKSGEQTGFTAVGNSDFQLGDNVTNKTHLGHFTFYFEPVVHEPNHIMIARDVVFQGYYGGAGTQWFGYDSRNRRYEKSGGWDQIENKIQAASRTRPSLLAALAFHHESKDQYICDPMSITGNFHKDSILRDLMDDDIPHYASSPYYSAMLGAQLGGTLDDTTNSAAGGMFHTSGSAGICYQGLQCSKDAQGKWEDYTQNTGHLGRCESLDSSLVWSGQIATKSSVNYDKASNSVSLFNKST